MQQLVDETSPGARRENSAVLRRFVEPEDVRRKKLEWAVLVALQTAQRIRLRVVRLRRTFEPRVTTGSCTKSEVRPLTRAVIDHGRQRWVLCQRLVVEHQIGWQGFDQTFPHLLDLVDQRRNADDGIVLEEKCRYRDFIAGQAEQIDECRAGAVDAIPFRWPTELSQNGGRVEDVAPGPFRPLAVNNSGQLHILERSESC